MVDNILIVAAIIIGCANISGNIWWLQRSRTFDIHGKTHFRRNPDALSSAMIEMNKEIKLMRQDIRKIYKNS